MKELREIECAYKDEIYSVRDNGEVLRHSQQDKKPRPLDNKWTFGTPSPNHGYNTISGVPVHRIVATAFHGDAPSKNHVVDHIDTNRRNNRPENLRWLTRLENLVLNPITAKRIIRVCGSIEAFLENPTIFKDLFAETNFQWMGNVTAEEAKATLEQLLKWANTDEDSKEGSLSSWALNHRIWAEQQKIAEQEISEITVSLSPNAIQRNWRIPSEFPCCPQVYSETPIDDYFKLLELGSLFCKNEIYASIVLETAISKDHQSIYLISESTEGEAAIKPWGLAKITFENDLFVHQSLGSFFSKIGAQKQFSLAQGLDWLGEDSIDDYC